MRAADDSEYDIFLYFLHIRRIFFFRYFSAIFRVPSLIKRFISFIECNVFREKNNLKRANCLEIEIKKKKWNSLFILRINSKNHYTFGKIRLDPASTRGFFPFDLPVKISFAIHFVPLKSYAFRNPYKVGKFLHFGSRFVLVFTVTDPVHRKSMPGAQKPRAELP